MNNKLITVIIIIILILVVAMWYRGGVANPNATVSSGSNYFGNASPSENVLTSTSIILSTTPLASSPARY